MAEYNGEFLVCVENGEVKHGYSPESGYTEPFRRNPENKVITENPAVNVIVADEPPPEDIEDEKDDELVKEEKLIRRLDSFKDKLDSLL